MLARLTATFKSLKWEKRSWNEWFFFALEVRVKLILLLSRPLIGIQPIPLFLSFFVS